MMDKNELKALMAASIYAGLIRETVVDLQDMKLNTTRASFARNTAINEATKLYKTMFD